MSLSLLKWTYLPFDERCRRISELSEKDQVSVRMGQAEAARVIDTMIEQGKTTREEVLKKLEKNERTENREEF